MEYTYLQFKETINNIINNYVKTNKSNKKSILDFILSSINKEKIQILKRLGKKIKITLNVNPYRYDKCLIIYKKTKLFNLLFSYNLRKAAEKYDLIIVLLHRSNHIFTKIFKEYIEIFKKYRNRAELSWLHVIFRFIDKEVK